MVSENKNVVMRCPRCNRQVPLNEMKYDREGKLVCRQCSGAKPEAFKETPSTIVQSAETTRTYYICTECRYRFSRGTIKPSKCPYCGKDGTLILDKSVTGGSLLDES